MAPEVPHSHSPVTPNTPSLSRIPPRSRFKQILHQKHSQRGGGGMKFTKRKFIPVFILILCSASIFRFLNISMIINSSARRPPAALLPIHQFNCSLTPTMYGKNASSFTEKELQFLLKFFSTRVPCNLLIFGLEHQYSRIARLNAGGLTLFLEDNRQITSRTKSVNNTRVVGIMYNTVASEAYQLLRDARRNQNCLPMIYLPKLSKCNLALSNLPREVYDPMWDVVVVDGPKGDAPDSPGRMASIYTASVLARRGNTTHVVVHDADRMIEKWFSREYLCEDNLVSSKGRFQHFQIQGVSNATTFCSTP